MRYTTLPLALLLLGVGRYARAQIAPDKAPAPLTLAQALTHLPPPAKGVLLTVGADKVALPDGTLPPPADASPTVLANTFGDIAQDFGAVTTLAPATRVLLNSSPLAPDLSTGVSSLTGFKMLTAELDDAQWKALTSESGLGLADLTDDTQRLLFHGLFPQGQLWVATRDAAQEKPPKEQRTDTRNVSDQIDGVRLRIRQTSHIYLHDKRGQPMFFSGPAADPSGLYIWHPENRFPRAQNVILRAIVLNTPKPSDLPLGDARFQQTVSLMGTKTVAELIARIAAKTHTEIYADPHYAARTLTIIGPAQEAPAADVLRALALAVAGAYRQVGSAFVLTDDIEGVGTRRTRLAKWDDTATVVMLKLKDEAGEMMLKRRLSQARSLPTFGDPLALTPEQMAGLKDSSILPGVPGEDWNYPYAKLTPAQQRQALRIADAYEDALSTQADSSTAPPRKPDPTGAVILSPYYAVQYLIPTVQGLVEGNNSIDITSLYYPGHATSPNAAAEEAKEAEEDAPPKAALPPALPLPLLLRSRPRRAVIGHPTTPAAVDALIAAMQKVGLNELWLDVFSQGKSRLADTDTDILTEALTKTQDTGITVYADLSLLPWGSSPPKDTWDLDILGQNSQQAAIADHAHSGSAEDDSDAAGKLVAYVPPPVLVSPASASVRKTLVDMVRGLASRPGLAGFIWADAVRGGDLGYTPEMRLAFLRAFHADPMDIDIPNDLLGDVSLLTFDDKAVDTALTAQWNDARIGANAFLLTQMRAAIPASVGKPILMERSENGTHSLVRWDDPRQMPPPLWTFPSEGVTANQSRTSLVVSVRDAADTEALARKLQKALTPPAAKAKAPWDGYVLDFDDPHVTDSTEPLRDLIRAVTPKEAAPPTPTAAAELQKQ